MDITEAYAQYAAPIRGYIYRRVNSPDLADDLTQDTFERAIESWGTIRGTTARAWLYRIAHNLIVDYLRRGSLVMWSNLDAAAHVSGLDEIEQCGEREQIETTLSTLKPKYASALRLTLDGGNLPYEVLAEKAGVSRDLFKHWVCRGRKLFAEAWQEAV